MGWWPCGGCYSVFPGNCSLCGTTPSQFQVEISGVYNHGACSDCADLNGTYTLDQVSSCEWRFSIDDGSGCDVLFLSLTFTTGPAVNVSFSWSDGAGGFDGITWRKNISPNDCDELSFFAVDGTIVEETGAKCRIQDYTFPFTGPDALCYVTAL